MHLKPFTVILLFLCLSCEKKEVNAPAISNTIVTIVETYGGTKNDVIKSVVTTTDGGYIMLGHTQSNDGDIIDKLDESFDYWVLKFNADSELQWRKTYGGSLDDRGTTIIQTQDGGYAVIGYSQSNDQDVTQNSGAYDFWLAKLTENGTLSWQKSLGYSGTDKGLSVIQTTDNGYFLTGSIDVTASGGAGNSRMHAGGDYWAIKLTDIGEISWTKYFGGNLNDLPNDAVQTPDGGFIMVGTSDSTDVDISENIGAYDYWIIKIDHTGVLVWEQSFGGEQIEEAHSIVASNDGNYIIVGDSRSSNIDVSVNNGAADVWCIKITPSGELLWEKSFGGASFDSARSIVKTPDNGYLISGSSRSENGLLTNNNGQNDAMVIYLNQNMDVLWQKTIGGSNIDIAYSIVALNESTVIAVGETSSADFDIIENKGFSDGLILNITHEN